jgi:hypothetical protein
MRCSARSCVWRRGQVLTANLGSTREALDAGADISWLPLQLQFDKDEKEKL